MTDETKDPKGGEAGDPPETAPAAKDEKTPSPEEQLAAAKKIDEASRARIPMTAPKGVTAASAGGRELKVTRGRVMVEFEHVEQLIAHGFSLLLKDVEKAL